MSVAEPVYVGFARTPATPDLIASRRTKPKPARHLSSAAFRRNLDPTSGSFFRFFDFRDSDASRDDQLLEPKPLELPDV